MDIDEDYFLNRYLTISALTMRIISSSVISMCALFKLATFSMTKPDKTHAMLISKGYLFLVYTVEPISSRLVELSDNNREAADY